ncbi:hypothetical protein ES702_00259 [subsurface metagenome]
MTGILWALKADGIVDSDQEGEPDLDTSGGTLGGEQQTSLNINAESEGSSGSEDCSEQPETAQGMAVYSLFLLLNLVASIG